MAEKNQRHLSGRYWRGGRAWPQARQKEESAVARLFDGGDAKRNNFGSALRCRCRACRRTPMRDWVLRRHACRLGFFCADFRMQGRCGSVCEWAFFRPLSTYDRAPLQLWRLETQ